VGPDDPTENCVYVCVCVCVCVCVRARGGGVGLNECMHEFTGAGSERLSRSLRRLVDALQLACFSHLC
jgi:hypothetical protein